ncbi:MAG: orotidine-5'-phosphate decarboxylase [Myxococcota bacterium]
MTGPASPRDRLVFPLDVPDLGSATDWLARLAGEVGVFKVGLELFTSAGPAAVQRVHQAGAACFLDLKLHDIPATMAKAVEAAARLDVRYLTVHASAGPTALHAAADAARGTDTRLLAVTVLTSLAQAELAAVGIEGTVATAARRLAGVARDVGIDGLVTSAHECAALRSELGEDTLLVVPGIRPPGSDPDDQQRAATPAEAVRAGADLLVVGRPIRTASNPVAAARDVVDAIGGAAGP